MKKSIEDCIEILECFNEKLEDASRHPEFMNPDRTGVQINYPGEIERHGPEERFISSVLLPLRFFLHTSEDTNLNKMGEMYKAMSITGETKGEFRKVKKKIDSFLNSGSGVKIFYDESGEEATGLEFYDDGKGDSKRTILDLFRNGYYEHMNARKKPRQPQQLASIKKMPEAYAIVEQIDFIKILRGLIQYYSEIKKINKKAISELKKVSENRL